MSRTPRVAHLAAATFSLFALVALAAPVSAQSGNLDRAKGHYQQGVSFYDAGDYQRAITEFTTADQLAPSPLLDYNIGLCHERLGNNADALRHYRRYRTRVPQAANAADVDSKIARLEAASSTTTTVPDPVPDPGPGLEPDPDPGVPDGSGSDPITSPETPTYAPTGDAELDRVAAVDLNEVAARHPGVAAGASSNVGTPPSGDPSGRPASAPMGPPEDGGKKEKPIYKKWWFWVVVGVSAIILIDVLSTDSSNNNLEGNFMDPSGGAGTAASPGGVTFRF